MATLTATYVQCPACQAPMVVADGKVVTEHADVTLYDDQSKVTLHDRDCRWHGKPPPSRYEVFMRGQGL